MTIIGITGGIGSGKSTVSNIFHILGIPMYIADIESKRLTDTSPIIKEKLISAFGTELYVSGKLNKQLFASYIFSDKKKLELANSIIHPEVNKDFLKWVDSNKYNEIIVVESAILFEAGMNILTNKTLVVYTPIEERIQRVMRRDKINKEKVLERIEYQIPDEEKIKIADHVIYNDETMSLIQQSLNIISIYDRRRAI